VVLLLVDLFTLWTSEGFTFRISDIVRRDGDQLPAVFSRIAQEVKITLSPVMLIEQDFSVFPLHNWPPDEAHETFTGYAQDLGCVDTIYVVPRDFVNERWP